MKINYEKIICPKCKSENCIPIIYTDCKTQELLESAKRGSGLLSDGDFSDLTADYCCKKCGFSWCTGSLTGVDVRKIRFKYWANFGCCDPNSDEPGKDVYEFTGDGKVKHLVYPFMSKKVLSKEAFMVGSDAVMKLFDRIVFLLKPWNMNVYGCVCDGESYEMTVTYTDGRKKKVNGNVDCTAIDEAVFEFLRKHSITER